MVRQAVADDKKLSLVTSLWNNWKPPLTSYLQRGGHICWYLQTHEPPLVLDFTGTRADNYTSYSPETEEIAFVVWPAVLAGDGQYVLSSGVAKFFKFREEKFIKKKKEFDPYKGPIYYYTTK